MFLNTITTTKDVIPKTSDIIKVVKNLGVNWTDSDTITNKAKLVDIEKLIGERKTDRLVTIEDDLECDDDED